jgi:hypothetical protein
VHSRLHRRGISGVTARFAAVGLSAALLAALAALPAASAASGPVAPGVISPEGGVAIDVPVGQLASIASLLPVSDLDLTPAALEQMLQTLPGLSGLSGVQKTLLQTLLSALPANTTLGGLSESVLSGLGVPLAPVELLEALALAARHPGEVADVVGDLAGGLSPAQLSELQAVLGALTGALSGSELTQLQTGLEGILGSLGAGKLASILGPLEGALTGVNLSQLQTFLKDLGSFTPAELQQELGELVGALTPSELSEVLGQVFGSLSPAQVQPVLESLLGGLSFSPTTAGQLASTLGVPLQTLATEVGSDGEDLSPTAGALTAPLGKEGQLMSVLDGLSGLSLGVLDPSHGKESPGSTGAGGSGGAGGVGGSEGRAGSTGSAGTNSGGSSGAGSTTLVVNLPGASAASGGQAAVASRSAARRLAKVKILSHRVRGRVATLVIAVPAAGGLTLAGDGLRPARHRTSGAARVTLEVLLTRAAVASLHNHHDRLKVKLEASFLANGGARSAARSILTFR